MHFQVVSFVIRGNGNGKKKCPSEGLPRMAYLGLWARVGPTDLWAYGPMDPRAQGPRAHGTKGPWAQGPWAYGPWVPVSWAHWALGPLGPEPWAHGLMSPGPIFPLTRSLQHIAEI